MTPMADAPHIDDMLAKQRLADAVERCTDKGVTERPPVPGQTYFGFAVHSRSGLSIIAFAIAHTNHRASKYTLDLTRENISLDECCRLLKAYGISQITGANTEGGGDDLAHAALGAIHLATERDPLGSRHH
jgi:hypothetical protein